MRLKQTIGKPNVRKEEVNEEISRKPKYQTKDAKQEVDYILLVRCRPEYISFQVSWSDHVIGA